LGGKTIIEVAREKARKILAEHQPLPIDKDVEKRVREILKRATQTLGT
jgi:trimethylamine:corrinoid methyltransferase-like protein